MRLYWNMVQRFGGEKVWRRLLHVLRDVADKHQTNISSVAIQWVMAQGGGGVAYPIIGEQCHCRLLIFNGLWYSVWIIRLTVSLE